MKDVDPQASSAQTEQPQSTPKKDNPNEPTDGGKDVDMKDAEKPKPEAPKVRIRKEKQMRTFYHKVPLEVRYVEYPQPDVEKLTQGEEILRADDNYAIETLNSKNKLESSIFSTRDNLTSIWEKYSQKEEVNNINEYLNTVLNWLDDEGQDTTKEEYDNRYKHLQTLLEPILGRIAAELKKIEDERKAEEAKRLEEQKRIEEEKKKQEEEQKRLEEEKKKQEAGTEGQTPTEGQQPANAEQSQTPPKN